MADTKRNTSPLFNPVDRFVNYFFPTAGARRAQARAQNKLAQGMFGGWGTAGGYDAAKIANTATQDTLMRSRDGSADAAIAPDLSNLRRLSSASVRNSGTARSGLEQLATKSLGTGLRWHPAPDKAFLKLKGISEEVVDAKALEMARLWNHAYGRLDLTRRHRFNVLEYVNLHSTFELGDAFTVMVHKPYAGDLIGLKLQQVEAGRVSNPEFQQDTDKLVQGVELDDVGAAIAIHVCNRHPGEYFRASAGNLGLKWERLPIFGGSTGRRQIIQQIFPTRAGQTRGVPMLSTVLGELEQLTTYKNAELMATVINSCFALTTKTEDGNPIIANATVAAGGTTGGLKRVGFNPTPGMLIEGLGAGEGIDSFTPGRPSAEFSQFWDAITDEIGAAISIPGSVLRRRFANSYSASRAELLECYAACLRYRYGSADDFNEVIKSEVMYQGIIYGVLDLPGWQDVLTMEAWMQGDWIGPAVPSLDPYKEAMASQVRIANNMSNEEIEASEVLGNNWSMVRTQRSREVARNKADGLPPTVGMNGQPQQPGNEQGTQNPDQPENEGGQPS